MAASLQHPAALPDPPEPAEPAVSFAPHDFAGLAAYIKRQADVPTSSPYTLCSRIACYANNGQRQAFLTRATADQRPEYAAGVTIGSVASSFPAQGSVGIVVSSLDNAVAQSAGHNEWHAVGILRRGPSLWIYSPSYTVDSQSRLPMIPGAALVCKLLEQPSFKSVQHIQAYGESSSLPECMTQTARWVDRVRGTSTTAPMYDADMFQAGVLTPGWQLISRS